MKECLFIAFLFSASLGAAMQRFTKQDGLGVFFVVYPFMAAWAAYVMNLIEFTRNPEYRKMHYEAQMAKWRPVPRWPGEEPEQDGLVQVDHNEWMRLPHVQEWVTMAKVVYSNNYAFHTRVPGLDYYKFKPYLERNPDLVHVDGKGAITLKRKGRMLIDELSHLPTDLDSMPEVVLDLLHTQKAQESE